MKVIKKQKNSRNCIICGMDNLCSVKAPFYEMEDKRLVTIFSFQFNHQSYPERTHGGMITAMLDELIGRALWIDEPNSFGVTMNLNVKFRKPVPYDEKLVGIAKLTKNTKMFFGGVGKIFNENGEVLAEAEISYVKQATEKIATNLHEDNEMIYDLKDDVNEIDLTKYAF